MRRSELNLVGLTAAQRAKLYQRALDLKLLEGIPPGPKLMADPLVLADENSVNKVMWCHMINENPDASPEEKEAARYAFHIWRERVDVWGTRPFMWFRGYDPTWQLIIEDRAVGLTVYNTFISAYELERYFLNPWIRARAWLSLFDNDYLDMMLAYSEKGQRGAVVINFISSQPLVWWQRQNKGLAVKPVKELKYAIDGFVPTAQRGVVELDSFGNLIRWDRESAWAVDLRRDAFNWFEFKIRSDEIQVLLMQISLMLDRGYVGGGYGNLIRDYGRSVDYVRPDGLTGAFNERREWTIESKLLKRLFQRIKTFGTRQMPVLNSVIEAQIEYRWWVRRDRD